MYGYVFEGKRHGTGDKLGFLKATIEFALKRPDLSGCPHVGLHELNPGHS
jgi:UTP--glucose-1-phosphate uridylyltransferase